MTKKTPDIKGKWFIENVVQLKSNKKVSGGVIECPYMKFSENQEFTLENGILNAVPSYWEIHDIDSIIIYSDKTKSKVNNRFVINQYENGNKMLLRLIIDGKEEIEYSLNKKCKE